MQALTDSELVRAMTSGGEEARAEAELYRRFATRSVPVPPNAALPAGFSFNQFLIAGDEPLLFHTGPRRLFPLVREAIAAVLAPESLRSRRPSRYLV